MKTSNLTLKVIVLFLFTLFSNQIFAQDFKFYIDGGAGIGEAKTTLDDMVILNGLFENELSLSWHLGISSKYFISNNIFLEAGLQYLNHKTTDRILMNELGVSFENKYTSSNYFLSIPLKAGYTFNKIQVKFGYQWNNFLSSNRISTAENLDFNLNLSSTKIEESGINASKLNHVATFSLSYQPFDKITIEGYLNIGLSSMSGPEELLYVSTRKSRIMGINLQYEIFSNQRSKQEY